MLAAFSDLSFGQFLLVVVLAAALSMVVYRHASKHGSRHATAWGIAVFLVTGLFLPLYFLHYYLTRRR